MGPVKVMKYNHIYDVVISADAKGVLEYWSPVTLKFPENRCVLKFFWLLCSAISIRLLFITELLH